MTQSNELPSKIHQSHVLCAPKPSMVNSKYALALSLGLQGYYKYNRIKNVIDNTINTTLEQKKKSLSEVGSELQGHKFSSIEPRVVGYYARTQTSFP